MRVMYSVITFKPDMLLIIYSPAGSVVDAWQIS